MFLKERCGLYFDSTIPHGMRSVGDKEAKMLVVIV